LAITIKDPAIGAAVTKMDFTEVAKREKIEIK